MKKKGSVIASRDSIWGLAHLPSRRDVGGRMCLSPDRLCIFILLVLCWTPFSYSQEKDEKKIFYPLEIKESENGGGKVLTLNLKSANIISVLRLLSKELNLNIIPSGDVTGTVDGHFVGTPEEVLDLVLKYAGPYTYFKEGNNIKVVRLEIISRVFKLKFLDAFKLKQVLQSQISDRGAIDVLSITQPGWSFGTAGGGGTAGGATKRTRVATAGVDKSNILIVSDVPSVIDKIERLIAVLDTEPKQVMIEAKIVEVSLDSSQDLGIDWQSLKAFSVTASGLKDDYNQSRTITGGSTDPTKSITVTELKTGIISASDFSLVLNMLQSHGDTNLLSSARIMTMDGQEAAILTGERIPIVRTDTTTTAAGTVQRTETLERYESVGIQLLVVPQVSEGGYVNMTIHPEVSEAVFATSTTLFPRIQTRESDTQIMVKDGDTVVIGGLIKDKEVKTVSKVPLLGDLPILGIPFKKKSTSKVKTDLMVFITPHIVTGKIEGKKIEVKEEPEKTIGETYLHLPSPQEGEGKGEGVTWIKEEYEAQMEAMRNEMDSRLKTMEETSQNLTAEKDRIQSELIALKESKEEEKKGVTQEVEPAVKLPETPEKKEGPKVLPEVAEQIKAFNKDEAKKHFELALTLIETGSYVEAKDNLKKALELNPEDIDAKNLLTRVEKLIEILEK